jgi:signal transduction histidine kinase
VGIPARDLPRVFDRFFQVESHATRQHGGLGLGLPVAKTMVELHGGQIWAESIEGRGSKFSFLIPLQPAGHA